MTCWVSTSVCHFLFFSSACPKKQPNEYKTWSGACFWSVKVLCSLNQLPEMNPWLIWWTVLHKAVAVKYQAILWHCHHNSIYTQNIICHFAPDVSPTCLYCPDTCYLVDHWFHLCPTGAIPLWSFILSLFDMSISSITIEAFLLSFHLLYDLGKCSQ